MPGETAHFVLSDCVQARIAPKLRAFDAGIYVATSLREVNCADCRKQMERIADSWLVRYQNKLTPMDKQIRKNADVIQYQLDLIKKLEAIVAGKSNDPTPRHQGIGDRCPTCSRGALKPRYFRAKYMLACDQFPKCDYARAYLGVVR